MTSKEAVNWIINISADIGKQQHQDLWHYEQALSEIKDILEAKSETKIRRYQSDFSDLEEMPERKTGKWIIKGMSINCSVCKKCSWSLCFEDTVRQFNYCPHCGARMGVEDD